MRASTYRKVEESWKQVFKDAVSAAGAKLGARDKEPQKYLRDITEAQKALLESLLGVRLRSCRARS